MTTRYCISEIGGIGRAGINENAGGTSLSTHKTLKHLHALQATIDSLFKKLESNNPQTFILTQDEEYILFLLVENRFLGNC